MDEIGTEFPGLVGKTVFEAFKIDFQQFDNIPKVLLIGDNGDFLIALLLDALRELGVAHVEHDGDDAVDAVGLLGTQIDGELVLECFKLILV